MAGEILKNDVIKLLNCNRLSHFNWIIHKAITGVWAYNLKILSQYLPLVYGVLDINILF